MKQFSPIKWFRNISISRKLYFTVGIMAVLIIMELFTLWFSISTLSSVRASVGAEGLWTKSQKDAILQLNKYARTGKEEDYTAALQFLKVPFGDRKAFAELEKEKPDREIMRQGYLEAGINKEDVDGVVDLFLNFGFISYINKAIAIFHKGDALIMELEKSAAQLHSLISGPGSSSQEQIAEKLNELNDLNVKFTALEVEFSNTLGEGSRWLEGLILKLLFFIALTVEISGLLLAISVSRAITKGINEIIRASEQVANRNFKDKAAIYSKDEIGQLASSFNNMTEDLAQSNQELEQFVYLASHDLQEPLRTISNYVGLLEEKYAEKKDSETALYMKYVSGATVKMQHLIKDLLDFSRIGREIVFSTVDCNVVLNEVISQMEATIRESHAKITSPGLPVLRGNEMELKQLFQNLISNAIKFRKKNIAPELTISGKENHSEYLFSFKDNGIGIEEQYQDRIFVIFQRLHLAAEYPGTGIGLATCKKIVELHNGKIWIDSKPGEGSTFYFTIPKKIN